MNDLLQATIHVANVEVDNTKRRLLDEPVNEDLLKKNKFANNSEYVPESVYKKILNKMTGGMWSFIPHQISTKGSDKASYVEYIGLLVVPGYGIHTGIGTQSLNKKDNQNATAAAKTYAFKNACKEMGLAPNVGDEDWDQPVFETEVEEIIEEKKKEASNKKKSKDKGKDKKSSDGEKKERPLKDRIKELRDAYELDDDDEFVAFLQVWNEDILDPDDMSESDWKKFFKYHKENKEEFEDF